jgi:hypothetical protein
VAPAFDPQLILATPAALDAFRELAAVAREAGAELNTEAHPLSGLSRGEPVARAALEQVLSATGVEALARCGAFELGESATPSFGLMATGRVVVPIPLEKPSTGDVVYIGTDSALLVEAIWMKAPYEEPRIEDRVRLDAPLIGFQSGFKVKG